MGWHGIESVLNRILSLSGQSNNWFPHVTCTPRTEKKDTADQNDHRQRRAARRASDKKRNRQPIQKIHGRRAKIPSWQNRTMAADWRSDRPHRRVSLCEIDRFFSLTYFLSLLCFALLCFFFDSSPRCGSTSLAVDSPSRTCWLSVTPFFLFLPLVDVFSFWLFVLFFARSLLLLDSALPNCMLMYLSTPK